MPLRYLKAGIGLPKSNFMRASANIILFLIIGVWATSCSPVLYSPVGQNVPLFKQKGESLVSAGIVTSDTEMLTLFGESNYAEGPFIQAAAAVDSNLAFMSSYYFMQDKEASDAEIKGHGSHFEIGVGKFWPIKKSKWIGEVFVGTAIASIKNKVNGDALEVKYSKPFIQPSIGYRGNVFEFAFTSKIGIVNYFNFNNQLTDQDRFDAAESFESRNKTTLVFEPGFTWRIGWKNIKFQAQTCATTFSYSGWEGYEAVNQVYVGVGLLLRVPAKQKL